MNIKQTLKQFFIAAVISAGVVGVILPGAAQAVGNNGCETDTSIIKCNNVNDSGDIENTGIWSILLLVINIMTVGVGILAVAGIVYGSVLYTSAGGSPDQVKKARTVIVNVVVGILAYLLMFSVLNFIIPGGVFA